MKIRIIRKPSWLPSPPQWPVRKVLALLAGVLVTAVGFFGVYSMSDLVFTVALRESDRIFGDPAPSGPTSSGPASSAAPAAPSAPASPSASKTPPVAAVPFGKSTGANPSATAASDATSTSDSTPTAGPALPNPGQFQNKGQDFFSEYRMERERVRSQQIEILQEIVRNDQSSGETRKEAQKKLLQISEQIKKEMETERLLIANSYRDAVVLIQPNTVSVIVAARELSPAEKGKIAELVARSTGVKTNEVSVMNR
ncbi:hypothetical protein GTO91_01830 [Heliobacterium undosum]|uniref:SpoIIIAH-like family protein n=1 Tax=Heliomicrobium undosum TaxID=121734 RepID=A0A845KYC7_9FIRM|nr:SpoIIIAH-like family protein [Heliomicrobium undosum]MZP28463.1 hypothetical protein [Heliomicrobium undosum]